MGIFDVSSFLESQPDRNVATHWEDSAEENQRLVFFFIFYAKSFIHVYFSNGSMYLLVQNQMKILSVLLSLLRTKNNPSF